MSDEIPWTKEQMRDEMEFRGKLADNRRDDIARLQAEIIKLREEIVRLSSAPKEQQNDNS